MYIMHMFLIHTLCTTINYIVIIYTTMDMQYDMYSIQYKYKIHAVLNNLNVYATYTYTFKIVILNYILFGMSTSTLVIFTVS